MAHGSALGKCTYVQTYVRMYVHTAGILAITVHMPTTSKYVSVSRDTDVRTCVHTYVFTLEVSKWLRYMYVRIYVRTYMLTYMPQLCKQ